MILSEIYQWIQLRYPYFSTRGPGWRNSIRHNLSLNDCFIKVGLIAKAILSTQERRMILSEIYQWIQLRYPYFSTRGPGWRNSIRHNLSLNDCFIKV
ncbi:uncharacterized protein DC041_0005426, partial [Schistosoma bovis]